MQKYSEIFLLFKDEIEQIKHNMIKDLNIPKPIKLKLEEFLNSPSKHIRPLVSLLILKSLGYEVDSRQIEYQTAIELVHNASLIHDDVIDESDKRRNIKTINFEFDNKLAVLSGDYLLSLAQKKVLNLNFPELTMMFCETLETMTKGEFIQYFSKFSIPSIEEYLKKSEQKTAKLFETAICGSLYMAGYQNMTEIKDFAKNFGTAFQIRDDLINCKTSCSDIKEGIYTAPVIFSKNENVSLYGIEKTQSLLNNYIDNAQSFVQKLNDSIYKTATEELLRVMRDGQI